MRALLDMLGRAISQEVDALDHGALAARSSPSSFASAGQPSPAVGAPRSAPAPVPQPSAADKRGVPLYQLSTGPIVDRHRAEDIVSQLLAVGLSATMSVQGQPAPEGLRVVSEVLLSSVAERRAAGLADLHPEQEVLSDGRLRLQFGMFGTEQEATALAEAIRRRGYGATVEATGGTRFVVTVNPTTQAAINRSIAIIKTNVADLTVSVQAVP